MLFEKTPKNNLVFDKLVHISKASELIDIAEKTLRNWRAQGRYPQIFVKLGGRVFVNMEEFALIVERQTEKAIEDAKRMGLYE